MSNIYLQAIDTICELLDQLPDIPEHNCSCHLSPPCNYCVDWSHLRAVVANAEEVIKLLNAHNLIEPN